jgi:hypothetical protein
MDIVLYRSTWCCELKYVVVPAGETLAHVFVLIRSCPFDPFVSVSHIVTTFHAAAAEVIRDCATQALTS